MIIAHMDVEVPLGEQQKPQMVHGEKEVWVSHLDLLLQQPDQR